MLPSEWAIEPWAVTAIVVSRICAVSCCCSPSRVLVIVDLPAPEEPSITTVRTGTRVTESEPFQVQDC